MEYDLVGPTWLSACTSKGKALPVHIPIPYSFCGKITKSYFYSACLPLASLPKCVSEGFGKRPGERHSFPIRFFRITNTARPNSFFNPSPLIHSDSQSLVPDCLFPDYLIPKYLFPLESWYTAPRAPIGADVSGNCFDHYRSMPDGNQLGLFCCQTPRFRKEARTASRQWDGSRRSPARDWGTESSKRCPSSRIG